jgi:DNA processing protein
MPMNSTEMRARLTLRALPGLTERGINELIRVHGSATSALCAPSHVLAMGAKALPDDRIRARVATCERIIDRRGIQVICSDDPRYPRRLRMRLEGNCPSMLFTLGDASILRDIGIAIVGSRLMTDYGRHVAEQIAGDLTRAGLTIISGLARGIDGVAHQAALDAGGETIAVVGNGVDVTYPPSNRMLRERIIEQGVIVSQFLPGDRPLPYYFPERNLTMALLAEGVLVVEAGARSGASITAHHATDFGIEAMAIPGPIFSASSAGSNALLATGAAACVTDASEILAAMDRSGRAEALARQIEYKHARYTARRANAAAVDGVDRDESRDAQTSQDILFSDHSTRILDILADGTQHLDGLSAGTGLPMADLLAALLELELAGIVRHQDGGRYELRPMATA